jgi:antitoxin ParD1/3/4
MNISLTPELERLVNEKVKSGRYASASEVIREGLRLQVLRAKDKIACTGKRERNRRETTDCWRKI